MSFTLCSTRWKYDCTCKLMCCSYCCCCLHSCLKLQVCMLHVCLFFVLVICCLLPAACCLLPLLLLPLLLLPLLLLSLLLLLCNMCMDYKDFCLLSLCLPSDSLFVLFFACVGAVICYVFLCVLVLSDFTLLLCCPCAVLLCCRFVLCLAVWFASSLALPPYLGLLFPLHSPLVLFCNTCLI